MKQQLGFCYVEILFSSGQNQFHTLKNTTIQKYTQIPKNKKTHLTSYSFESWANMVLINRLEPTKGEEWQESNLWAGPQTGIHTHSKPPCDRVFQMPSRSPHITVCTTMIHSQPTCDCAGNAENFDLLCFSRSIFIYNLHYYQVQLRPTNSPLENGKRVEHRGQQDTFFQSRARISGTQFMPREETEKNFLQS